MHLNKILIILCVFFLVGCTMVITFQEGEIIVEEPTPTRETATWTPVPEFLTTSVNLNCRSGPSSTATVIAVIPSGTSVMVLSESPGWYQVRYLTNQCWSSAQYLK